MADKYVSHVWTSVLKFGLGCFLDGKFPKTGGTSHLMCCLKRGLNSRTGVVYIGDLGWVVADRIDRSFLPATFGFMCGLDWRPDVLCSIAQSFVMWIVESVSMQNIILFSMSLFRFATIYEFHARHVILRYDPAMVLAPLPPLAYSFPSMGLSDGPAPGFDHAKSREIGAF